MDPTKSSKDLIFSFIKKAQQTTPKEIQMALNISQVTLFKHLKTLISDGKITKTGTPPKVYYFIIVNLVKWPMLKFVILYLFLPDKTFIILSWLSLIIA